MALKIFAPIVLVLSLAFPAAAPMAQDAQRFVSVINDLPLMSGLVEAGEGVEFATPGGRIAEATAHGVRKGAVSREAVLAFYAQTLPQLGWAPAGGARFVREGETLDLQFGEDGGALTVRFSLAPTDK